jgi:LysM repeat protein
MATYIGNKHTVQSGESLSAIAAKYGIDWQTLYALNKDHLRSGNPNVIYPGENLVLPGDSTNESGTTQQPKEANEPNTLKERNQGTVVVTRPYGLEPGSSDERVLSDDSYDIEIKKAGPNKPATDAIAGDVAEIMKASNQMRFAENALNEAANSNKLLIKTLEEKNKQVVRKQKLELKLRVKNLKTADKILSKKSLLTNDVLDRKNKVQGYILPKQNDVINYQIQQGDTLLSVAKKFGISYAQLLQSGNNRTLNTKHPNGVLWVGDKIAIPKKAAEKTLSKFITQPLVPIKSVYIPPISTYEDPAGIYWREPTRSKEGYYAFIEGLLNGFGTALIDTAIGLVLAPIIIGVVANPFSLAAIITYCLEHQAETAAFFREIVKTIAHDLAKFWDDLKGENTDYDQGDAIGYLITTILLSLIGAEEIVAIIKGGNVKKIFVELLAALKKNSKNIGAAVKKMIKELTEKLKKITKKACSKIPEIYKTAIDDFVVVLPKKEIAVLDIVKSFKDKYYRTVKTKSKVNVYRDFGDMAPLNGGYTTTNSKSTRESLALLDEWKNSMRFKAEIEIPVNTELQIGKVGKQPPDAIIPKYNGGDDQILLPRNYDINWIKKIIDTKTGKSYSLNEFKKITEFQNLIRL